MGTHVRHADPSSHPVEVGQRTEAIVLAALVKLGHRVLVPFGANHRYDLAVDLGDRFVRVQCFGEIDLFAVYCPDTDDVYAVPVDEAPRCSATLRVMPAANGQMKGVRWAKDYLLERQLAPA